MNKYVDKENETNSVIEELPNPVDDLSKNELERVEGKTAELSLKDNRRISEDLMKSTVKSNDLSKENTVSQLENITVEILANDQKQLEEASDEISKKEIATFKINTIQNDQDLTELNKESKEIEVSSNKVLIDAVANMESVHKRKANDVDLNELQESVKRKSKHVEDLESEKLEHSEKEGKSDKKSKEVIDEAKVISDSRDKLDSDNSDSDGTNTIPSTAYSKFINKPNYLLNKLGLHFGSAESSQTGSLCKQQKLNLFVSKSKFKTINHRLKIDTKEELWEEDSEEEVENYERETRRLYNEENKGYDFKYDEYKSKEKKGYDFKYSETKSNNSLPNKHTYFKYSDDEENVQEENTKTSDTDRIFKNEIARNANVEKDIPFTATKDKSEANLNDKLRSEIVKTEDINQSANESPDEFKILKQPLNELNEHLNHDKIPGETNLTTNIPNETSGTIQNSDAFVQHYMYNQNKTLRNGEFTVQESGTNQKETLTQTNILIPNDDLTPQESDADQTDFPHQFTNQTPISCQKKKRRKKKKQQIYEDDLGDNVPVEILGNAYLEKYYMQRYLYWSRYDEGILMDEGKMRP